MAARSDAAAGLGAASADGPRSPSRQSADGTCREALGLDAERVVEPRSVVCRFVQPNFAAKISVVIARADPGSPRILANAAPHRGCRPQKLWPKAALSMTATWDSSELPF